MVKIFVRVAHVTVALTAFVWFVRNYELAACHTVSSVHTDGLFSDSPFMVSETCLVPDISVAVLEGDSILCRYTRRARHATAACLVTFVGHVAAAPFAARFTHILAMAAVRFPIT